MFRIVGVCLLEKEQNKISQKKSISISVGKRPVFMGYKYNTNKKQNNLSNTMKLKWEIVKLR